MTCEVKQVAAAAQQQRIVQTGVQWEQAVAREAVVEAIGQTQYAGMYEAGVVGVREGGPVMVEPVVEHLRAVQTGPVEAREIVQPIRTEYMQRGMVGGLELEYVSHGGQQLAFYADHHLRTLSLAQLREHAMLLYRTLGHQRIGTAVPISDAELFAWILDVQRLHLAPLRIAAPRAVGGVQPLVREAVAPVVPGTIAAAPRAVEVVQPMAREYIQPVPRTEVRTETVIREVDVPQVVEKIVEVPQVSVQENLVEIPIRLMQERVVEVPTARVCELVRQTPHVVVEEVVKQIARPVFEVVEKVVEVPQTLVVEVIRQVPNVQTRQVQKQVGLPVMQFR